MTKISQKNPCFYFCLYLANSQVSVYRTIGRLVFLYVYSSGGNLYDALDSAQSSGWNQYATLDSAPDQTHGYASLQGMK